jgi:hypothetical protein
MVAGQDQEGSGEGGQEEEALGQVKGFDFDTLLRRKPHLRQELLTFRDTLQYADDNEVLKAWPPGTQCCGRLTDRLTGWLSCMLCCAVVCCAVLCSCCATHATALSFRHPNHRTSRS